MATGFLISNGTDLDDVFDPYVTGTSPSTTGYLLSSGTDINTRYAPLSYGSAAAATGYQLSTAADLNTLFAAKGTAKYWPDPLPWEKTFYAVPVITPNTSRGTLEFRVDGNLWWKDTVIASGINQGTFLPSGVVASQVEIRAVQISGVAALQNDLASFVPITSTRSIVYSTSSVGSFTGVFEITIRRISNISDSSVGTCSIVVSVDESGGGE